MFHSSYIILWFITLACLFKLWILLLSIFIMLSSCTDIESIRSKESIDLFLKFWQVIFFKSIWKNFNGKIHHCLIEILIIFLIFQDLRLKLHETVCIFHSIRPNWGMRENNPWILIRHLLCLLQKFSFFRRKDLRNRQTSLSCFLF